MKIKHLQLNTSLLRSPEKIVEFIKTNNIDIACLQEIVYPIGSESPLKKLAVANNLFYVEGVHFNYQPNNQTIAAAIISKYPIIDFQTWYFNLT